MKTLFDNYDAPSGIVLSDPSPPSALRMVFWKGKLIGQMLSCGDEVKAIRGMGDSTAPYFHSVQEAIGFLKEHSFQKERGDASR